MSVNMGAVIMGRPATSKTIFRTVNRHPQVTPKGIILVPWNYSPCVILAAYWCLTHTTSITEQYFKNISTENPYKVITGIINTSNLDLTKYQTNLGIKAVFHPDPLVAFILIKVVPEFQRTLYVNYGLLKFNTNEPVTENCESFYWLLNTREIGNNYFFEYLLMNQIPCPYVHCHHSNTTSCSIFKNPNINDLSATIQCNDHLMSFAEFGHRSGSPIFYHNITDKVITWIEQNV